MRNGNARINVCEKGKSVSLKANVQPSNATNKAVTWSSKMKIRQR
ncbi:Ig-like domain-containing protein [Escherichia coli]